MNDDRLNKLFAAAARVEAPVGGDDLPERVLRAVRRERVEVDLSLLDQLGLWLPRVAAGAAAVLALCLLAEFAAPGGMAADLAQISEQWLFAAN
jgi:hypothetical protein